MIDRFKDEMKQVTITNKKLKDYNLDNEKKLKHLQSKMKDIDLYEEINIPRMIQVVEGKQKRIQDLEQNEKFKFASVDRNIRKM